MKNITLLLIFSLFLTACNSQQPQKEESILNSDLTQSQMTEAEARTIAEVSCIKGGKALDEGYYNENSKTWWFDANLNATKPGCNPKCVVSEETKTAEVNWECTEAINTKIEEPNPRVLLTSENTPQYVGDPLQAAMCDSVTLNDEVATIKVNYKNSDLGIDFDIPYNPVWGNDKFKINPYEELYSSKDQLNSLTDEIKEMPRQNRLNKIRFGPLNNRGACTWLRAYYLTFSPPTSDEEVLNSFGKLPESLIAEDPKAVQPSIIKLNDLTVVKGVVTSVCEQPTLEVIGKNYNYKFQATCSSDTKKDFKTLEDIVKSVKLIK